MISMTYGYIGLAIIRQTKDRPKIGFPPVNRLQNSGLFCPSLKFSGRHRCLWREDIYIWGQEPLVSYE